jgi:biotin synthase
VYIIAGFCQFRKYLNRRRKINLNSPEFIQTSLAAAISLGLEHGSFKEPVTLTGLNLLLTYEDGCIGRCSYCGISGLRQGKPGIFSENNSNDQRSRKNCKNPGTFIRVKWPVYRLEEILEKLIRHEDRFKRVCISMITHRNAVRDTIFITEKIKNVSNLPLSLLISPTVIHSKKTLEQFRDAGAEMIGVAIDAASRQIFKKYRGTGVHGPHNWEKYWRVLKWAVDLFGEFKTGIHLIVGLGETEKEAVEIIFRAHKSGAKTHLFSFYPEACTGLADSGPPDLLKYRRVQIARFLINERNLDISEIEFDNKANISSFNYDLAELLKDGYAFMTSGCPCRDSEQISACNRPFANERPSEAFRNYPYVPDTEDLKTIEKQIADINCTVK